MAIETEKKYRLSADERRHVEAKFAEWQIEPKAVEFEENIIYSGGNLREKDAVLRLRRVGEKTVLTYKESLPEKAANGAKERLEHETRVEKFEEAEKIFELLGFKPSLVYEKRRATFHFREVEIVLDELPFGEFMEIEGTAPAIAEAEMLLEIEHLIDESKSYPLLTAENGTRRGDLIEARFAK